MITTSLRKKAAAAALVALTFGAGLTAQTGTAEARGGRNGVAAVGALAAIAGLAIVAGSAQAHAGPQYYGHDDGYAAPVQYFERGPSSRYYNDGYEPEDGYRRSRKWRQRDYDYVQPGYGYGGGGGGCRTERRRVSNGYNWFWQDVQVCN
ncbi:MAG: hypothetical protein LCH39_03035 [Proteobacteria bacterium]|nr:hypothetical protein [Pseudomonadota bacterium]